MADLIGASVQSEKEGMVIKPIKTYQSSGADGPASAGLCANGDPTSIIRFF